MVLIFCEIIELDFCGLEENTRKNILERAKLTSYSHSEEDTRDSKEIWDGLELNSESQTSVNNSF